MVGRETTSLGEGEPQKGGRGGDVLQGGVKQGSRGAGRRKVGCTSNSCACLPCVLLAVEPWRCSVEPEAAAFAGMLLLARRTLVMQCNLWAVKVSSPGAVCPQGRRRADGGARRNVGRAADAVPTTGTAVAG